MQVSHSSVVADAIFMGY